MQVIAIANSGPTEEYNWHDNTTCHARVEAFHDKIACVPKDINVAKSHHRHLMDQLHRFLEKMSLCKRLEYTGISSY